MPRATILYFASLGDLLQRERETCDLPETATSGDILACIATCHPDAASLLSTCRVAVAAPWGDLLPPPSNQESRLLRFLKLAAPHHRLACQIILGDQHDGLAFFSDPPPSRLINTTQKETTI